MSADAYIEEDRIAHGADRHLARRLLRFVRPYWRLVALSSGVSLLVALLQLAGPWLVKETIDHHIATGDMAGVVRLSGLYLLTISGVFALEYLQGWLTTLVGQRAMFDLRRELFAHLQRLHPAFFDRNPVGRLMTRVTNDVAALNELFAQGVMTLAGDVFLLAAIAALMLWTNWVLALLVFATAPLLLFAAWLFRRTVRAAYRDVRARLSLMNAFLQENLSGMRTVQAYNRQRVNFDRFRELNDSYREANLRTVTAHALFVPAVELIGALATGLILWYGGASALEGTVTLGTIVLFIQYVTRFFQPLRELSDKFNVFQTALASGERIFRLLDTRPEVTAPDAPRPFEGLREEIRFEDVWFAYKDDEWVLKDISFRVRRGETVALVGATGSGKTTITNLLCRFYDVQRGSITIDGVDLRALDPLALRRRMAIVLQDVFLFSGTIADNIRLGNESISDEQVRRAAQVVNAARFIEALPGQYAHEVRERGATLSVGQKQLLAFARALAFDPEVLILDEATASIDTETELLIQDALRKLLKGRTSIVIAHRLSTVQNADRIIVLHKGRIRESGTHAELLRQNGLYRKLYELQYRNGGIAHGTDDALFSEQKAGLAAPQDE